MSTPSDSFLSETETTLEQEFLDKGYVIMPTADRDALDSIRALVAGLAADWLKTDVGDDPGAFLDTVHERVSTADLNALRLAVINGMNNESWLRAAYYRLAADTLGNIVGNELAMQRRVNLSIQMPDDDSSLLPVHADVWSGDSPFEVVLWVPLVDCFGTKTMYLLPPEKDRAAQADMSRLSGGNAEALFNAIEPDLLWLDIPYGNVMVFWQALMHGNRINREQTTRWSMNCRFKSVFSPYADKRLGEFFEPITLKAASRLALDFDLPKGFDD